MPVSGMEDHPPGPSLAAEYHIRHEIPDPATYLSIRLAAGLSRKSLEAATLGLSHSLFGVVAYQGPEPVGIGRIIGDGGCFFQIVDMAVRPEHQQRGLGRGIMEHLMDYLRQHAPPTAYVSLMADHGTPEFYRRFGFEPALPPRQSGMFLRIP